MIFGFLPQNLKIGAVAGAFSMAWPGSEVEPRAEDDVPARDRVAAFRGELYRDPAAADRQPRRNPANPAPGTTGGRPPVRLFCDENPDPPSTTSAARAQPAGRCGGRDQSADRSSPA